MRILVLTSLYPNPLQPNRATFNRQQFQALAAEHEVQVIAPVAWTDEWSRRGQSSDAISSDRKRLCDGMVVHHPRYVFTPKILRSQYGAFFAGSVRGCFADVVRTLKPEIVLGCWAYPDGWSAVRLAREAALPVAVKVHGSDLLLINQYPARRRRTAEAIAGADAVIAVSRDLATQATALGADPERVSVVYNGIDTSLFHPGSREAAKLSLGYASADPLIVFAGNLVPVKGLDVLLDALASVQHRRQPFQCALIGDGPLRDSLRSRAETLGLSSRLRFLGARPLLELPSWYRAADVVVLPSRSEGVPNVLLEAAACGAPFIASRVGGIPEIAASHSLVEAGDPAKLADRILSFLTVGAPAGEPLFRAGSWADSARSLAAVLRGVVGRTNNLQRRAG
jgi:glycosyltransferase involved in cell wall biosynthesis